MTPWTVACKALLSMEFSRQEYWSGDPGIKTGSPTLQADTLPSKSQGSSKYPGCDCSLPTTLRIQAHRWTLGQISLWSGDWDSQPQMEAATPPQHLITRKSHFPHRLPHGQKYYPQIINTQQIPFKAQDCLPLFPRIR